MPALFKRHRAFRLRHRMSDDKFFETLKRTRGDKGDRPTMANPGRRELIAEIRQRELEKALEEEDERARLRCLPSFHPAITGFFALKSAQPQAGR